MEFGPALAGRANQRDGDARLKSLGHQGRLAVARHTFDAHFFRIHLRVGIGFKVVNQPADAPTPSAQSAPVVGLARLALVDETNNPLTQRIAAAVCLNAGGINGAITPSMTQCLLGNAAAGTAATARRATASAHSWGRWRSSKERRINLAGSCGNGGLLRLGERRGNDADAFGVSQHRNIRLNLPNRFQLGLDSGVISLGQHRGHRILLSCGQLILQGGEVGLDCRDASVKFCSLICRQWAAKAAAAEAAGSAIRRRRPRRRTASGLEPAPLRWPGR